MTKVIHARVDEQTHRELSKIAKDEQRSLSFVVSRILRDGAKQATRTKRGATK